MLYKVLDITILTIGGLVSKLDSRIIDQQVQHIISINIYLKYIIYYNKTIHTWRNKK